MYRFTHIIFVPISFLLLCIFSFTCGANQLSEPNRALIFLGNEDLAPISYSNNDQAEGVAIDITRELEKLIDREIIIKTMNWKKAQEAVISGEADALIYINVCQERLNYFDFSQPILESEFALFVNINNQTIKNLSSLQGKKVGVEYGGFPFEYFQDHQDVELQIFSNWEKGFSQLVSGSIDAIIVDKWIGEYHLAQNKINNIQIINLPMEHQHSTIAVKKGNTELLNAINSGLEILNNNGTIGEILTQWKGHRVIYMTEKTFRNTLLYSLFIFLIIVIVVSLFFVSKYRRLSKSLEKVVSERTKDLYSSNKMLLRANSELEKLTVIDDLTSMVNRRGLETSIHKVWSISMRQQLPLSAIMVDIDYFKQYNDTYGHLAGDECLISVAEHIQKHIRGEEDISARFGGEEFIILLFNTEKESAIRMAELIRKDIEKLNIKNEAVGTSLTVSCGVATVIPEKYLTVYGLIDNADQALYWAKQSGRNTSVHYREHHK